MGTNEQHLGAEVCVCVCVSRFFFSCWKTGTGQESFLSAAGHRRPVVAVTTVPQPAASVSTSVTSHTEASGVVVLPSHSALTSPGDDKNKTQDGAADEATCDVTVTPPTFAYSLWLTRPSPRLVRR